MICPTCGHDNVPGAEECSNCYGDLTQLDRPMAQNRVERSLMEDPVAVLQPREPLTLLPIATVADAIRAMLANDVGALLVVDTEGKLLGILSERDLLTRVAGIHEDYSERPVVDFMTPKPDTISASNTLAFALHKMDLGGYRHMPLTQDGRPAGVISVRDIMRHITRLCRE
jgi:signal-transduction protein with cAMP-binding, CBS, and nucleotidyltransferase domain